GKSEGNCDQCQDQGNGGKRKLGLKIDRKTHKVKSPFLDFCNVRLQFCECHFGRKLLFRNKVIRVDRQSHLQGGEGLVKRFSFFEISLPALIQIPVIVFVDRLTRINPVQQHEAVQINFKDGEAIHRFGSKVKNVVIVKTVGSAQ